jgi:hypothetical protein
MTPRFNAGFGGPPPTQNRFNGFPDRARQAQTVETVRK